MVYLGNLLRSSSLQNMKLLSRQKFLSCSVCGNLSDSSNKFITTSYRHYSAALNSEVSRKSNQSNRTLFGNKCKEKVVFYNSNHLHKSSFHSITEIYMAVSESTPVTTTQNFLVSIHETSGLPWWATIAVTTILLRGTITMPLALYQHYILAKVENLKLELPPIAKELQKETEIATRKFNWTPELATFMYRRSLKKQWTLLIERDNCHPAKAGILVFFQLPMWILLSLSMRNLVYMRPHHDEVAQEIFHQLEHEGLLWIPNLTIPDTTMLIPSILCVVSLSIIEINRLMHKKESSRYKTVLINIFRGFAVLSFPFAMIVPSSLSFYWLTSATFGLCQNLIVMSPKVKLLAGIPRTPTTLSNPYSHLWQQIKISLNVKKPV